MAKSEKRSISGDGAPGRWRNMGYGIAVVLAVLAAYHPALHGDFVWDDELLTGRLKPLFLDTAGLWRMWADPSALFQYYPLTGTTFWLDRHLWGEWTLPYHLENMLLHACAALLFWRVLRRLELPGAWLGAAIFALHPVMIESVAFITERRNVLSMVLLLAAFLAYGRVAELWEAPRAAGKRWRFYVLALVLFAGALLAKVTAYVFPPAVLLLCWWKRGRLRWKSDVLPALPFFALAFGFGLCAMWMEVHRVGAQGQDWHLSTPERFLVAGRAFWFYLGNFAWPTAISLVYPKWRLDVGVWWQWLFPAAFLVLALTLWFGRKRWGRGAITALLFFVGALLPVLGFVNVYGMLYSFVADRWIYLPSLALCALVAVGVTRMARRWRQPAVVWGFAAVVLPSLLALTWLQSAAFAGPLALWQATLHRNPTCWMAYINLGNYDLSRKLPDQALAEYKKALELNPRSSEAHNNIGNIMISQGRLDEAESHLQAALELKPQDYKIHKNYAALLKERGKTGEAFVHTYYPNILQADQTSWGRLVDLAWMLAVSPDPSVRSGRMAVQLAERANELSSKRNPQVLQVLAAAYAEAGRYDDAVVAARQALALSGATSLADDIRAQMGNYEAKTPYHLKSPVQPSLPPKLPESPEAGR